MCWRSRLRRRAGLAGGKPTGPTGRWGNRLAALMVNTVPPYRTSDVATVVGAGQPRHAGPDGGLGRRPPRRRRDAGPGERRRAGGAVPNRRQHHGHGPTYYGRYASKAVITRAQRPDIQLASMLPQTRCLVLTGPGEPTEYVKAEARERDNPLLQVFTSTIETADALDYLIDAATSPQRRQGPPLRCPAAAPRRTGHLCLLAPLTLRRPARTDIDLKQARNLPSVPGFLYAR